MTCKHIGVRLVIQVRDELVVRVGAHPLEIVSERPIDIHILATCEDCGFTSIYNGHAHLDHAGASAWPTWLLNRLVVLANGSVRMRRALMTCHVPGVF